MKKPSPTKLKKSRTSKGHAKTKSSDLTNVGERDGTTPTELALVAVALSHVEGKATKPQLLFGKAKELIEEARDYLLTDWNAFAFDATYGPHGIFPWAFPEDLEKQFPNFDKRGIPIPFEILLRHVLSEDSKKTPLKKMSRERTVLGAITTMTGLEKAIARYFPPDESEEILRAKTLTVKQIRELRRKRYYARSLSKKKPQEKN